ncbi:hypothetical protein BGZ83_009027 [Gryganskiella cystojenkinii]|nr:hypothetical protein BGZ83_009027 [Gryganskiella cystojenkinii]
MVTTRSRVNKQTPAEVAASKVEAGSTAFPTNPMAVDDNDKKTDAGAPPLKRKSASVAFEGGDEAATVPAKIPKTALDSDLLAEAKLPQAPASTPVPTNAPNAREQQPVLHNSNASNNNTVSGTSMNNNMNMIPPLASGPKTVPQTATPSAPPVPTKEDDIVLESLREPAPESVSLPEVTTVLTAPVTDQIIESLVASSTVAPSLPFVTPPAPTAPTASSVPAIAPVTMDSTRTSSTTVAPAVDGTVGGNTAGAETGAPVLPPIPTDPLLSQPLMSSVGTTMMTSALPLNNNNSIATGGGNTQLSDMLIGIDAATANAAHAQAQAKALARQEEVEKSKKGGEEGISKLGLGPKSTFFTTV